mgnify:FL=1
MNRNNYPINEPIFPHWSNLGARLEAEADRHWEGGGRQHGRWHYRQQYESAVSKDWSRWKYMEFRYATDVDAKKRICEWCNENPFRKNDIVIREQVSQQDFNTLHVQCAKKKLESIRESFNEALKNMDDMIYRCHGDLTDSTYDIQNN